MTLEQLQTRTLEFLKLCRRQLLKMPHEEGLNDVEFIDQVLNQFRDDILTDRAVLKMAEQREPMDELHYPTEMTAALADQIAGRLQEISLKLSFAASLLSTNDTRTTPTCAGRISTSR